jgi:hypothetical protein
MTNDPTLTATNLAGTNVFVSVSDGHIHIGIIARILWILLPQVLGWVALFGFVIMIVVAVIKGKKNSN